MTINIRRTARAIILNSNNQVLLLKINDKPLLNKMHQDKQSFWVTIGGELEVNESIEEALQRELLEEVGITKPIKFEHFAFGEQVLPWKGLPTRFIENFFIVRADKYNLSNRNLTSEEMLIIGEYRWWSVDEMLKTKEVIFPGCLANLLIDYMNHSEEWLAKEISLD